MVEKKSVPKFKKPHTGKSALMAFAFIAWAAVSFIAGQFIVGGLYQLLAQLVPSVESMNDAVLMTTLTALSWAVTLAIGLGGPYLLFKQRVTLEDIGLHRLPSWAEIGLGVAGYIASTIVAAIVVYLIALAVPGFDSSQAQNVGFSDLFFRYEYVVAFLTLVVIAPIVEEVFFRGYLYNRLKRYIPTWVAILAVSLLFGAAHGQLNVGIMTFVMSIFLCLLRDLTGSLWPAIVMHMTRNGIAFSLLFVVPSLFLN